MQALLTPQGRFWTHLEIDDHRKDKDGGDEVHEVGEVLAVECLPQGSDLVGAGGQQVEQRDDGALELHSCYGGERGQLRAAPGIPVAGAELRAAPSMLVAGAELRAAPDIPVARAELRAAPSILAAKAAARI